MVTPDSRCSHWPGQIQATSGESLHKAVAAGPASIVQYHASIVEYQMRQQRPYHLAQNSQRSGLDWTALGRCNVLVIRVHNAERREGTCPLPFMENLLREADMTAS